MSLTGLGPSFLREDDRKFSYEESQVRHTEIPITVDRDRLTQDLRHLPHRDTVLDMGTDHTVRQGMVGGLETDIPEYASGQKTMSPHSLSQGHSMHHTQSSMYNRPAP